MPKMALNGAFSQLFAGTLSQYLNGPREGLSGLTERFDCYQGRGGIASVYGSHAGAPQF